jgi:lactoylglutathione lyase
MQFHEVVPFLAVADMRQSLAFYIDGIGFAFKAKWEVEGELRWCHLQLGNAGLMLQQFPTKGHDARRFSDKKGDGIILCFFPADAVQFYRDVRSRGLDATEPSVSNGLWTTHLTDPDGYQLLFESPTDIPEETRLSSISPVDGELRAQHGTP